MSTSEEISIVLLDRNELIEKIFQSILQKIIEVGIKGFKNFGFLLWGQSCLPKEKNEQAIIADLLIKKLISGKFCFKATKSWVKFVSNTINSSDFSCWVLNVYS